MVGRDQTILLLCLTVFLSYLPEAGEYSSLFVYLRLVSVKKNLNNCMNLCVKIFMIHLTFLDSKSTYMVVKNDY